MTAASHDTYRHERQQRVRIGLTGLAAVFLVIATAGALTGSASDEMPVDQQANVDVPAGLPELVGNDLAAETLPKEPLAELGVAPSTTPDNAVTAPRPKGP